jgi:hypothetical protein
VPTKCLTSDGKDPQTTARPILGGWTTASVRQARVINPQATYDKPAKEGGAWAQVSRLGMPLTNEVVIGIADKDRFNSSEPRDDAQFLDYVTNPTLPQVLYVNLRRSLRVRFPSWTSCSLVREIASHGGDVSRATRRRRSPRRSRRNSDAERFTLGAIRRRRGHENPLPCPSRCARAVHR